ncbi:acetylornithine deacetylase/Succinyl-diaminopimelate desuccinylase [Longilinea arvoryzae]|uniref:Acetylornithine deacetylase/Succinyl-diaminopimelate desuccinylase n=1 Tax=Longilinea arvoryzae TaxID=360412 RepID=A0A0S7BBN2_9CHLR|nr:M20/M25/M40 family metallo-hydrolase [Longilinea arvoryzae]GAP15231.1 acetylornithine deacetylase/Succinyl-diaminopimelate desuccinylase [Longilinea arvoryzae]
MESVRWQALERCVRFLESNSQIQPGGYKFTGPIPDTTVSNKELTALLDLACQIQQVQSPTFDEGERAAFMLEQFRRLGLSEVHLDAAGNALARLPGENPGRKPVVLSAHLDTVFARQPELPLKRMEDWIVGPGIGDNSLSLAALISTVNWLKKAGRTLTGDVWLAANVCEEGLGNLRGMRALVDEFGDRPLAYLILEGMGLGNIYTRGLGVSRYRIQIDTPGGHSWSNYGQPSAIHEMGRLVARLADLSLPSSPRTSLNIGVISGGTTVNSIASHASIDLDLRSVSSQTLGFIETQVITLAGNFQQTNVQVRVESIGKRDAGEISTKHPLVEIARCVIEDLGVVPKLEVGSTDANIPLSRGLPAICIGLTQGAKAHTQEEYILTEPLRNGFRQVLQLLQWIWVTDPEKRPNAGR